MGSNLKGIASVYVSRIFDKEVRKRAEQMCFSVQLLTHVVRALDKDPLRTLSF